MDGVTSLIQAIVFDNQFFRKISLNINYTVY